MVKLPVVIGFVIVLSISTSFAVILNDCGSQSGRLLSLTIPGCDFNDDDDKCDLVKNKNASLVAKFQTFAVTKKANLKIWGIIMHQMKVPFAIEPDACTHWGVHCPLNPNSNSTMTIMLPVKSAYPSIPVDIEMALMDDKNESIFCVKFSAQIKERSKTAKIKINRNRGGLRN